MIHELALRNFRRFRHENVSLGEGINVVKGPNESGKSTLVQAMLAAFYWKVDATSKEVRESVTWGESGGFSLEVEGEASGRRFRLEKDFSSKRVFLSWGDVETGDQAVVEEYLKEMLGLGSEVAYRSTAGIRQDEVAVITAGKRELSERLQRTVTGSGEGMGALEAAKALSRESNELRRGMRSPAKNPGPLAGVDTEIARWLERRDELSRQAEERVAAMRRLEEVVAESERLSGRLQSLEALAVDSAERADIEEDIEDFHRRYRQLESAASLIAEDRRLEEEERVRYGELKTVLESRRDELGELEMRRAGVLEGLDVLGARLREARKSHYRAWAPYALLAGITLMLLGLAGIALSPFMLLFTLAGAACVAAALFPGGYLVFLRRGREHTALEEQVRELEDKESEIVAQVRELISEAGCDSLESFTDLKLGYLELLARRREIAGKLEVLAPDGDISGVEEEARRLASEVSLRDRRLKELRGLTVDAARLQEVLREKNNLRSRLDELKEERIRLEVLMREEGVEEELLRVEEELEYLRERRVRLQRRADALDLAGEWLEEATTETLSSAARRLESMIGEYIGRITDDRYRRVRVDEGTFEIMVWSGEREGEVDPEFLSRGTVDQLYLAARLSLVEIICGDRRPPLLLDDPFVTFDRRRLERAMEVIRDFARERQIIIFTCGDQYDEYADRLVELA